MIAVGIDLGLEGAVAVLRGGEILLLEDCPLESYHGARQASLTEMVRLWQRVVALLGEKEPWAVAVERPVTLFRAGQADTGSAALKHSAKLWRSVISGARRQPDTLLSPAPQTWQAGLRLSAIGPALAQAAGYAQGGTKAAMISRCLKHWPALGVEGGPLRGERGGWRDGRADALGLAQWAAGQAGERGA